MSRQSPRQITDKSRVMRRRGTSTLITRCAGTCRSRPVGTCEAVMSVTELIRLSLMLSHYLLAVVGIER